MTCWQFSCCDDREKPLSSSQLSVRDFIVKPCMLHGILGLIIIIIMIILSKVGLFTYSNIITNLNQLFTKKYSF